MAKLIEKIYGDALFDLSLERNNVDEVYEEVKALIVVLDENEDFKKFLNHPKISREEKEAFLEKTFKGRILDDTLGFLKQLVVKDRQGAMRACLEYYIARVKEYKKIGVCYVTTAVELNEDQKKKLVDKLLETSKYTSFEMNYAVDNSLIGGMVIRINDRVVDSTVKSKINNLTRELYDIQLA